MPYSDTIRNTLIQLNHQSQETMSQRTEQERQLAQLRRLREYVEAQQRSFNQIQDRRQDSLHQLRLVNMQSRAAQGYIEHMSQITNGAKYSEAVFAYTDLLNRLDNEIAEAELQIKAANRTLSIIQDDTTYYKNKLNEAMAEERLEAQHEAERNEARRNGAW